MASCLNNSLWTVRVWQICQQMKLGVRMGNVTRLNCMRNYLPWTASAPPVPVPSAWFCHTGLSTGWLSWLNWASVQGLTESDSFICSLSTNYQHCQSEFQTKAEAENALGTYSLQWTSKICAAESKQAGTNYNVIFGRIQAKCFVRCILPLSSFSFLSGTLNYKHIILGTTSHFPFSIS